MGGHTFTSPGCDGQPALFCPRMPTDLYLTLRARFKNALEQLFGHVEVPREAPGKLDYGDIDYLVLHPRQPVEPNNRLMHLRIGHLLGAVRLISPSLEILSLAVEIPDDLTSQYFSVLHGGQATEEASGKTCVQVDIMTVDSEDILAYTEFTHAYGDMSQILALMLRHYGLAVLAKGFTLRIPAIEAANAAQPSVFDKPSSQLVLSLEPDRVLSFLGLDRAKFRSGFADEDELFNWIAGSRLFDRALFVHHAREGQNGDQWSAQQKSRERQRKAKRHMFKRFVDDWLPSHAAIGVLEERPGREAVLEEALHFFEKHPAYSERTMRYHEKRREWLFWEKVRQSVPEKGDKLNLVLRGLKRWTYFKPSEDNKSECLCCHDVGFYIDGDGDISQNFVHPKEAVTTGRMIKGRIQHIAGVEALTNSFTSLSEVACGRESGSEVGHGDIGSAAREPCSDSKVPQESQSISHAPESQLDSTSSRTTQVHSQVLMPHIRPSAELDPSHQPVWTTQSSFQPSKTSNGGYDDMAASQEEALHAWISCHYPAIKKLERRRVQAEAEARKAFRALAISPSRSWE